MAEMVHSDAELGKKLEPAAESNKPAVPPDSAEAGPSNDELEANSEPLNGLSPTLDGDLHSPERPNINAMREALEAQSEMEVGKPIAEKVEEIKADEAAGAVKIDAQPGKQIII